MCSWASPKCTNNSHVFRSCLWGSRCSRQQDCGDNVFLGVFLPQEPIPACVPWWLNSLLSPGSSACCVLWGWWSTRGVVLEVSRAGPGLVLGGSFQVRMFCDLWGTAWCLVCAHWAPPQHGVQSSWSDGSMVFVIPYSLWGYWEEENRLVCQHHPV